MRRSLLAVVPLCRLAHWRDPCCRGRRPARAGEARSQLGSHPELVTAHDLFQFCRSTEECRVGLFKFGCRLVRRGLRLCSPRRPVGMPEVVGGLGGGPE
jgi:hypothetical protein